MDLLIIGTGSAGLQIAYACREAGWQVAVADSLPYGGTCANRGCDPKKVLVGAADIVDAARRMAPHGVHADHLRLDWPALMRFKHSFTDPVPPSREAALEKAGITRLHGQAKFIGPQELEINTARHTARHIVIAAGASPIRLDIPGEDFLLSSTDFLDLPALPPRLAFVGGGYIAFEFAHLAARAGSEVTILHRGPRPLEAFEASLVDQLLAHTRKQGIQVRLSAAVQSIERHGESFTVQTADARIQADAVFHAAGRALDSTALNLPAANIDSTKRGIKVNEFLQSVSNPSIYAAGDAADSGAPLTPVAGYEGRVVLENLLHGNHTKANYRGFASTVFTIPPLASTGLTEAAAHAQNLQFEVKTGDSSSWYSSRRIAEECSGYKIMIEKGTGRILGAHLLGAGSEEMINIFALAIHAGLSASDVRETLFAYPTHGSNAQYML